MASGTYTVTAQERRSSTGLEFDFGRAGSVRIDRDELVRVATERYPELPSARVARRIDQWLAEGSP